MGRITRFLSLSTILLLAQGAVHAQVPDAPLFSGSSPGEGDAPSWYVTADALLMTRTMGTTQTLATNRRGVPSLAGKDFEFNWQAGPRIVLGLPAGASGAFELLYFGLYDHEANATFGGIGRPVIGPFLGSFFTAKVRSELHDAEANYRCFVGDDFSLLVGFRYLNFTETFAGSFSGLRPLGPISNRHQTDNNLYGGQIGANYRATFSDRLAIDLGGKAGLFGNDCSFDATALSPLSRDPATTSGSTCQTSFVGEVNLTGTVRLADNVWVRGGYQVMWLTGVALAMDQLPTSNFGGTSKVDAQGDVFYHGAYAGLELRW